MLIRIVYHVAKQEWYEEVTLQLVYHRPREKGVKPAKTYALQVVVR